MSFFFQNDHLEMIFSPVKLSGKGKVRGKQDRPFWGILGGKTGEGEVCALSGATLSSGNLIGEFTLFPLSLPLPYRTTTGLLQSEGAVNYGRGSDGNVPNFSDLLPLYGSIPGR